jgi:valyl-tRNA synthetase
MNIDEPTIMLQRYPAIDQAKIDEKATSEIEWLKKVIIAIRNIRGEMNISPNKKLPLLLNKGSNDDRRKIEEQKLYLQTLAKLESINWVVKEKIPTSASTLIDSLELHLVISDAFDLDAEIIRTSKETGKLKKENELIEDKLNNTSYTTKAPPNVVDKDRKRLAENKNLLTKLQAHLKKLQSLKNI